MKFLSIVLLLAGCASHGHFHSVREHSHNTDHKHKNEKVWDQISSQWLDISGLRFDFHTLEDRVTESGINHQYLKIETLERISVLEQLSGGRRYPLKNKLIELELEQEMKLIREAPEEDK